jgi:hypothetical protein
MNFLPIKRVLTRFLQKFSSAFFPPICLHCDREMEDNRSLFCEGCRELLMLCQLPKNDSSGWLFEKIGPAETLYSSFARGAQVVFSKTLAAYMIIQMDRISWPEVDGILRPSKKEPSAMRDLARELAILLSKKVVFFPKKGCTYLEISAEMDEEAVGQKQKKMQGCKILGMGIFRKC